MKLENIDLMQMPWKGSDVPHALIEVIHKCNIDCNGCCKDNLNYDKPLEVIIEEIDLLASMRKLASLSISGGEPLLYKDLDKVISHIASKNVRPILLTNGSLLTKETLLKLKTAGLKRVALHIDAHQRKRPDINNFKTESDLNPLRLKYVNLCRENGVDVALTLTLYKDTLPDLNKIIDFSFEHNIQAILTIGYSCTLNYKYRDGISDEEYALSVNSNDVVEYMFDTYRVYPSFYLPSSHNKKSIRWAYYNIFYTKGRDGKVTKMFLNPHHKFALKTIINIPKLLKGRYSFDDPVPNQIFYFITLKLYAFLGFCPFNFIRCFKLLFKAMFNMNLRMTTLLYQQGANKISENEYEVCFNCPDITVRNGKFISTCVADFIEPVNKK